MAVTNKQRPIKKSSRITRVMMSWICITFLGWMILICWTLISWIDEGFLPTYKKVQRLALMQTLVVREFSDASFTKWLNEWVSTTVYTQSARLALSAQNAKGTLTQAAQEHMGALVHQKNVSVAPELTQIFNDLWLKAQQFWLLLSATGHLLLVKLAILVTAIPLFLLAVTAGLVDGLNQRAIRTASLGRESTYVFHKSIPLARKILFWVLGLWLAFPHALPPSPIFVSLSVLLSLVVSMTSSRFKKYL
jgi:integrating conjugative element membrane protein (TIGR03747 family)